MPKNPLTLSPELLLQSVSDGVAVVDDTAHIVFLNPAGRRLLGVADDAVLPLSLHTLLAAYEIFDDTGKRVSHSELPSAMVMAGRTPREALLKFVHRETRGEHWFAVQSSAMELDTGSRLAASVFRDISRFKDNGKRLALQSEASRMLAGAGVPHDLIPRVLAEAGKAIGADRAAYWDAETAEDERLTRPYVWDAANTSSYGDTIITLAPDMGAVGRAFTRQETVYVHGADGGRSIYALPLRLDGRVTGVAEFSGNGLNEPDDAWQATLNAVAVQLAQFLKRRRVEANLRESLYRYRAVVDSASDAILSVDAGGRVRFANPASEAMFGFTPAELRNRRLEEILPDYQHHVHDGIMASFQRQGALHRANGYELPGRHRLGTPIAVEAKFSTNGEGEHAGVIAVLRDVGYRQRYEGQQEMLRYLSDTLSATLDRNAALEGLGNLLVPRFADTLCISLDDDGKPLEFTRRPGDVNDDSPESDGVGCRLEVPLAVNGRVLGTLRLRRAASRTPFDRLDEAFAHELAVRTALSLENARLYAQARESIALRDDLLAMVSHDLKNPLTVITIGSELVQHRMAKGDADPDFLADKLRLIADNAERMRRLIEDLLDFAAVRDGRLELQTADHEASALLAELSAAFQPLAARNAISLEVTNTPSLGQVWCDRERILQVLGNLVGNALKFTPEGGRIGVSAYSDATHAVFQVCDNGTGIAEEHRPNLFERYWKNHDDKAKGTGLGLYIARAIVEAHGGFIELDPSHQPGASFRFVLPLPR